MLVWHMYTVLYLIDGFEEQEICHTGQCENDEEKKVDGGVPLVVSHVLTCTAVFSVSEVTS